jgi:hypothetical protein
VVIKTGEDRIAASAKSKELAVSFILRGYACGECNEELGKGALLLMDNLWRADLPTGYCS